MDVAAVTSSVALTAHLVCVLLLALTFSYLSRLFQWAYLRHWSAAWWTLLVNVFAIRASLSWEEIGIGFWVLYLSAGWLFLFYLIAGCRELTTGHPLPLGRFLPALPVAILAATFLAPFFSTFEWLRAAEAPVTAAGFVACLLLMRRVESAHRTIGQRMMQVGFGILALLQIGYGALVALRPPGVQLWISYAPLADFFAELLLGFGMVFVISEEARRELSEALVEVRRAHDQIERQARLDPLTETLNRHAFHSILKGEGIDPTVRRGHGTVVMVDLDHLKRINDRAGHPVGDAAIQAAAKAIRNLIRAEDFLFRWGGDEFLVLAPGLDARLAAERFNSLENGVPFRGQPEMPEELLYLSSGISEFGGRTSIQEAIVLADSAMYVRRASRRNTELAPWR